MVKYRAVVGDIKYEPADKDDVHVVANLEIPRGRFPRSVFSGIPKGERDVMLGLFPLDAFANYDERFTFLKALRYARDGGLEVLVEGDKSEDFTLRNARVLDIRDRVVGEASALTQKGAHAGMNEELKKMTESVPQNPSARYKDVEWTVGIGEYSRDFTRPYFEFIVKRGGNVYNVLVPTDKYTRREQEMLIGLLNNPNVKEPELVVVGQKKGPLISPAMIKRIFVKGQ
mgnify:CR=1 FL=1